MLEFIVTILIYAELFFNLAAEKESKHTFFMPKDKQNSSVKKWLGYSDGFAKGEVVINLGAVDAINSNKAVSLLPIGIVKVKSGF